MIGFGVGDRTLDKATEHDKGKKKKRKHDGKEQHDSVARWLID